jgi:hypothetical protein
LGNKRQIVKTVLSRRRDVVHSVTKVLNLVVASVVLETLHSQTRNRWKCRLRMVWVKVCGIGFTECCVDIPIPSSHLLISRIVVEDLLGIGGVSVGCVIAVVDRQLAAHLRERAIETK